MLNEFLCCNAIKNMYRYSASHLELGTGKDEAKPSYILSFIFRGTRKFGGGTKSPKKIQMLVCACKQFSTVRFFLIKCSNFKYNNFFGNGSECDGH